MHQERPTSQPSNPRKRHIAARMVWLLLLLLVVFSPLFLTIAPTILLLRGVPAAAILGLGMLEGALAGLAVDIDPAVVTIVPFCDPGRRDLRGTVVGLRWVGLLAVGLLRRIALTFALAGVGELADEVVEE